MKPVEITRLFLDAQDDLVLQASDLSLDTIANMVSRGSIDVAPSFQRRERWESERQSALIESFLLNIPVPPIYLSEDDFGRYSIIDGKQRIISITAFLNNEFRLKNLSAFQELDGFHYKDLPAELRNALAIRPYLRVVTLLKQSHPDLKYQVFLRLNRGGERLNAQEIRNVAFRGELNDLIYRLAENDFLRRQLKITSDKSSAYRNMSDAEYVLRFLTLSDRWEDFSGSLSRSMDEFMMHFQHPAHSFLSNIRHQFERCIHFSEAIWDEYAFKRPVGVGWRDLLIAGMYDAQMVAISLLQDHELASITNKKQQVVDATIEAVENNEAFDEAIRTATNTPSRIRYRVQIMSDILRAAI
ncbi:hypothetical protein ASG19_09980 [Rhizobium sp. Leaf306]|uniref:DUF262 domain-containing protein n=1 Tax=Rhizobium sp. Leaf306 TaxID=1736330 RepID=UPI0007149B98|nr:DUF262 domain-containing protein [Rhizobium sp. Leaf306]KQQ36718.1 hypothetical protein ASG19_09980 [Rhizobium sp. Leaf306]